MKIQYASDLHLEFPQNSKYLINNPLKVTGDILILAGDIHVFNSKTFLTDPFWDWASKNYKKVIVGFGNHEFYGGYDLSNMKDGFQYKIRDNVYYYYNCVISINDIDIIISPLWSHISEKNEDIISSTFNDFRLIKMGENILTVQDYNKEHEKCLNFIKKAMNESKAKTKIIVTHHVPSSLLYTEESDLDIEEGTTVDLTDYIKNCGAKYWIFGHSHQNVDEVTIGETRCLCNHVGYVMNDEESTFDNSKYIDLS